MCILSLEVNIKPNHGTLPILNWNPGEIYLQKDIESLDRTRSERDDKLLWAYVKSWFFVLFGTLFDKEWQSTDRHFAICEQKVAVIFEKTLSN